MENGNGQDGDSHGFRGGSKEGCVGLCIQLTFLSASQGQTGVCGRGRGAAVCMADRTSALGGGNRQET